MKVINVSVNKDTYNKLATGALGLDVRLDVPTHNVGDIIVYSLLDDDGNIVNDCSLAFLIQTKSKLEEFVQRIGEQMLRKRDGDSDELIIITLSSVPRMGRE